VRAKSTSNCHANANHHPLADALALSLIMASQSLLLVPSEKFTALPLSVSPLTWVFFALLMCYQPLLGLIMRTINDAFDAGTFLSSLQSSLCSQGEFDIHIPVSVQGT